MQLPESLLSSLQHVRGFNRDAFVQAHQHAAAVTSIRLHPKKSTNKILFDGCTLHPIPWCSDGYYLQERPSFTADPLLHAGTYYVQEASSMFLETVLKQLVDLSNTVRILDLCAAPGGKSTLIQSIINDKSLLVSNEVIKTRASILAENISKWGAANTIVTNNDPKDFKRLPGYFDVIVVDAPCSGSGLFRKDEAAIQEWSEHNVVLCSQRQQRILADVMPALKEGGVLIYSTCSYSEAEDEAIGTWLTNEFEMESLRVSIDPVWGIVETESLPNKTFGYRFYPDKVKGEGFFIAAFRKTAKDASQVFPAKNKLALLDKKESATAAAYLDNHDSFFFFRQNESAIAFPALLKDDLIIIQHNLYIKKAGVKLGTIIREELIPDHELALSMIITKALPTIEVDKETALQYLRKQDIKPATEHKGWMLISYQHQPLGWIKALPGRINNYYPKEWRILNK